MTLTARHPLADAAAQDWTPRAAAAPPLARSFAERPGLFREIEAVLAAPGARVILVGERGAGRSSTLDALERLHAPVRRILRAAVEESRGAHAVWLQVLASAGLPAADQPEVVARHLGGVDGHTLLLLDDVQAWDAAGRVFAEATLHALRESAPRVGVFMSTTPDCAPPRGGVATITLPRLTPGESAGLLRSTLAANGVEIDDAAVPSLAALSAGLPGELQRLAALAVACTRPGGLGRIESHDLPGIAAAARAAAAPGVARAWAQATIRARRGIFPEILLGCALAVHHPDGSFHVNDVRACLEVMLKREIRGLTNQINVLAENSRGRALEKVAAAPNARYRFLDARLEPYALLAGFEGREIMVLPEWLAACDGFPGESGERREAA